MISTSCNAYSTTLKTKFNRIGVMNTTTPENNLATVAIALIITDSDQVSAKDKLISMIPVKKVKKLNLISVCV